MEVHVGVEVTYTETALRISGSKPITKFKIGPFKKKKTEREKEAKIYLQVLTCLQQHNVWLGKSTRQTVLPPMWHSTRDEVSCAHHHPSKKFRHLTHVLA